MSKVKSPKFIKCWCSHEGLTVEHQDGEVVLFFWAAGNPTNHFSLWERIRRAWTYLVHGSEYFSEILLHLDGALELQSELDRSAKELLAWSEDAYAQGKLGFQYYQKILGKNDFDHIVDCEYCSNKEHCLHQVEDKK
jgi:hypothetical protein